MRIAIVCESDETSASTRYRAEQFARPLANLLGAVDVLLPAPPRRRGLGAFGRVRFFSAHTAAYASRVRELARRMPAYDAVLVQRAAYPLGPGVVARSLERFRGRLILDLDDAVFVPRPTMASHSRAAQWLYGPSQTLRLLARADAVVAGSSELAALIGQHRQGASAATVLPTILDVARYPVAVHGSHRPMAIGWVGTAGNRIYLDRLEPVFSRLASDGIATLEVVSSERWDGPAGFRRWSRNEEASVFSRYDVTIMPLPDTAYTRAKAGFKLLQSFAAGVGVVASPVGVNRSLVAASGAGLLADSNEEWEACLRKLASNDALRAALGLRGRTFAVRECSISAHAATLASLLAP